MEGSFDRKIYFYDPRVKILKVRKFGNLSTLLIHLNIYTQISLLPVIEFLPPTQFPTQMFLSCTTRPNQKAVCSGF